MVTTIQLDEKVKGNLETLKVHPRETFNEVIVRLVDSSSPAEVDKESLIETIEVLSDAETMKNLAESLQEIEKGNFGKSLDELEKELGL